MNKEKRQLPTSSDKRTASIEQLPQARLEVIRTTVRLLVKVVFLVFMAELAIAAILLQLPTHNTLWGTLLDATLAPMILLPLLYSAILKPVTQLARHQAKQAAELRFRTIAHAAHEGIMIADQNLQILFANAASEKMLGHAVGALRGISATALLTEGAAEFARAQAELFRTTGDAPILHAGVVELEGRRKDGKTIPLDISVSLLPGAGQPEFVIILRDISQRKILEEFLRESEAHFRMLADTAPAMLWLTDAHGNCTYVNQRWLEFTGRRMEEDLGAGWAESIHEQDREEELRSFLQCVAQRQEFAAEYRLRRADGEYRWVYDHGVPRYAPDGTLLGYIGACFDITERKTAEKALEESEAKFRALTESAACGIFISREDRLLYVNAETEKVSGYSREELLGATFWNLIHPDFRALVQARREARLAGQRVAPRYEFKIVTKSGEERWIDFTATAIEYEGQPAILGTAFDITERKLAEQRLDEQTALLDALVQTSPLPMVTVDTQGRAQLCNPAFEKLFQFTTADTCGQLLDELVSPPEKMEEARQLSACNISGESRVLTTTRRRKDGTLVEVEIHAVPLVVRGRTVGSYGIYVDLTERMKLQMYEKLLPVCCMCGKIRDDAGGQKGKGKWERLDHYVMKHSDARVSHTFCPHCLEDYKKQEGLK